MWHLNPEFVGHCYLPGSISLENINSVLFGELTRTFHSTSSLTRGTYLRSGISVLFLKVLNACYDFRSDSVLFLSHSDVTALFVVVAFVRSSASRFLSLWSNLSTCAPDDHLQVWWYQMLCNTLLTSWWWAHNARNMYKHIKKAKGKAVPLQAWSGPEGSRELRFPDFQTTTQDGKVVGLTHRPPLPPGNTPGTHFC
jgi:hypothetical protein